ncbi:hypothetical protein [Amycolatopsis sp. cg9]|uniref:hypothetical protein n=1 Tax=Amycolatopsis sp. cg9 TaxID=3238801 RepID=UPI0035258907
MRWDGALRELLEGEPTLGFLHLADALRPAPGEWLPAASDALPELLRHVEDRRAPMRPEVLFVVEEVARAARAATPDERWPAVWAAAVPRLTALLDDPAAEVRRAAALVPAADGAALLDRFGRERTDAVRVGLVVAIAEQGGESVLPWLAERAAEAVLTLAALTSIARITGEAPVDRLIGALRGDLSAYEGLHGFHEPAHVLEWAVAPLAPGPRAAVLLALTTHPPLHAAVFDVAFALVSARRSVTGALVPVFGRLLETAERGRAAAVLASVAPASAAYADRLFALTEDDSPAEQLGAYVVAEVRDVALWALLRLRDRRAVAPQLARIPDRVRAAQLAVNGAWHLTPLGQAPLLRELFGGVPEFAAEILPWLGDLLRHPADAPTVLQVTRLLTAWGPVAAPAAHYLIPHLGSADPRVVEWCADALGALGAGDERVLSEAAHRAELPWAARSAAATTLALLGGDPAAADDLLAEGLARREPAAVRRLASLGPAAAHHAPALRQFDGEEVAVACALAWLTGDVEALLTEAARGTAEAVRTLAELGPLPAAAAPVLRGLLARDERLSSPGGWRGIVEDDAIRGDAARALANCVD